MSENKRFENKRFTRTNTWGWTRTACINLMNELDEKNRKLKEQIKQQDELISEQAIQLNYLQAENKHMKDVLETNEQLKETIKELELENAKHIGDGEWGNRYHQFCDDDKALEDEEVGDLNAEE